MVAWNAVSSVPGSSHITQYEIKLFYLDKEQDSTMINRMDYGTSHHHFTRLKPHSHYKVGIATVDGSSQKSAMKYKNFLTNEAGNLKVNRSCVYNITSLPLNKRAQPAVPSKILLDRSLYCYF